MIPLTGASIYQREAGAPVANRGVDHAAAEPFEDSSPIRIGVTRGQAYGLTFFQGASDYYGTDVDLAARLQSVAPIGGIAMNEGLRDELKRLDPTLTGISGPTQHNFKGFPQPVTVFTAN